MNATIPISSELDWAELYREYKSKIHTYIFRRTSSHVLAEDLTADVFIKAIDYTKKGKGAQSSFSGWLFRIAHNLVIDHYEYREKHKEEPIDDILNLANPDDNPVLAAERAEDSAMLSGILNKLTPEHSEVLTLRYFDDCAFADIAEKMGKTEGAVKALQHRGLNTAHRLITGKVERSYAGHCSIEVMKALRANGPMTVKEIIGATRRPKASVYKALYNHERVFVRVGYQRRPGGLIDLWGLVGVHDKEAA